MKFGVQMCFSMSKSMKLTENKKSIFFWFFWKKSIFFANFIWSRTSALRAASTLLKRSVISQNSAQTLHTCFLVILVPEILAKDKTPHFWVAFSANAEEQCLSGLQRVKNCITNFQKWVQELKIGHQMCFSMLQVVASTNMQNRFLKNFWQWKSMDMFQ